MSLKVRAEAPSSAPAAKGAGASQPSVTERLARVDARIAELSKTWANARTPEQKRELAELRATRTALAPRASAPPANAVDPQQIVRAALADGPKGMVGQAQEYWNEVGKQGGAKGVAGHVMSGLLEFSGLPAVERSAAELGARVGAGDSTAHIAKASGKLALDAGLFALNGLAGGKAVASVARAARGTQATAMTATVVRHYTTVEKAAQIMKSGEIWASKAGNAGINKVYLVAESGAEKGMNFLRRLNIGYARPAETARAIEFDLSKLPPGVAAKFVESAAKGPLALEQFLTHSGHLDFNAFRGAVRVLDTEAMAVTMRQLGQAGASMGKLASAGVGANRAVNGE